MEEITCANKAEGKSGWLSPEGRFYPCKYGDHWDKARKILHKLGITYAFAPEDKLRKMFQWVSMESSYGSSYVSIATKDDGVCDYTDKQIKWLKRNYKKLDKDQQEYLDMYGILSGWMIVNINKDEDK